MDVTDNESESQLMQGRSIKGRELSALVTRLRQELRAGRYGSSEYLPPVRQLCGDYGVSFETVRRGLKQLELEGLLTSEARHGFRLAAQRQEMPVHQPVAYVTSHKLDLSDAQPANWAINQALTVVAARRAKSLLGCHVEGLSEESILARLAASPCSGLVLDTLDESLLALIERTGRRPLVMVNSWFEQASIPVVLQDNYLGGFLAARWLVDAGAKRVGWLGPIGAFCHTRERFAGVVAGLASKNAPFHAVDAVAADTQSVDEAARALLARSDRPDGIAAFTKGSAQALKQAADAAGLTIGKDLLLVGWTVEDCYESEHRSVYAGGPIPPAVVWSAREMAEAALDLLHTHPDGAPAGRRVLVRTRLRQP